MKATLTFEYNTDNLDETREIKDMQSGEAFKGVLWDLDQYLRDKIKYETELSEPVLDALQAARDFLHSSLREDNLEIE